MKNLIELPNHYFPGQLEQKIVSLVDDSTTAPRADVYFACHNAIFSA